MPLSGLALEIAASAHSGKSRFDIRLDPAELGRIDVRIDIDRNGHVTSHLMVEKPETLSMLRQDAPSCSARSTTPGSRPATAACSSACATSLHPVRTTAADPDRNAQRLIVSEEDSTPAVVAGRTYGRMLGSSSGVDIRV